MKFDFNKWDVEIIQDPNILFNKLKDLNIKNKKIKNIRFVGIEFSFIDSLEEKVYNETNSQELRKFKNFKDDYLFDRTVEIDEPIIITLEDNTNIEIDYSEGSTVKIGTNSLPKEIESYQGRSNVDGNVIFSNCLGKTILGYEVQMQDEIELTWDYTGSHGIKLSENQNAYISGFRILLSDSLSLNFKNFYDYGHIWIEEYNTTRTKISWKELKKGIINLDN